MNKKLLTLTSLSTVSIVLGACGLFGGGGKTIKNSAQLQSSILVNNNLELQAVAPCLATATTCTPDGFGGRVYAAGAMMEEEGQSGQGAGGYSLTFLAATEAIIERPDEGKTGSLLFDLTTPAVFSGLISIPGEDDMPKAPNVPKVEISFDYIDAKFTLSGHSDTAFNTEWTVRSIMVKDDTIGGLAVQGGDLLIKQGAEGTFQWCDSAGCSATRPTSPHRLASAVGALAEAGSRDGNPNYAPYSVALSTALKPTFAEISDTTRLWTLDFDIENAIGWTAAPSTFTTVEDFLANFKLPYACSASTCDTTGGIEATLTIGAANSAPATN